ncbi:DUF4129 domain-containing protein [Nocardia sp. 004]|uniref:DUF4129 domain-containing protein n=1 Tax=Nocardia sp. 004 TaxID=3385978 RepID=UPI0039A2A32D
MSTPQLPEHDPDIALPHAPIRVTPTENIRTPNDAVPDIPRLGTAADHRFAAESAAQSSDFDKALQERFRAVLRGLEQRGMLEVRRSRTARETAEDATTALPLERAAELQPAADSFDEVVYGGRPATEDDYRRLEYADQFSADAPPPAPDLITVDTAKRASHQGRRLPPLPKLLRNPKFWAALCAVIATLVLIYFSLYSCATPQPNPPHLPPPDVPDTPAPDPPTVRPREDPGFGAGTDPLWERLPAPVFYGGIQFLIAAGLLVWWRARRRGSLVREPRPVDIAANELLAGQAALYRQARDYDHLAGKLRTATLRRIRAPLGLTADTPPDLIAAAITAHTGADRADVAEALFGPVPDPETLRVVAAQMEWIESEVG